MAVGDGSWLKKTFPKIWEKRQAKQIEKAKGLAKNVNTSMEKKSKELETEIKNTKNKVKVRQLTAEKANIDRRRKYDKSPAGDAQMKIDNFVVERTDLRKKLDRLKTKLANTTNKSEVGSQIRQTERRLKDIQAKINDLHSIVKKHKIKKIVK